MLIGDVDAEFCIFFQTLLDIALPGHYSSFAYFIFVVKLTGSHDTMTYALSNTVADGTFLHRFKFILFYVSFNWSFIICTGANDISDPVLSELLHTFTDTVPTIGGRKFSWIV